MGRTKVQYRYILGIPIPGSGNVGCIDLYPKIRTTLTTQLPQACVQGSNPLIMRVQRSVGAALELDDLQGHLLLYVL